MGKLYRQGKTSISVVQDFCILQNGIFAKSAAMNMLAIKNIQNIAI
jgi:hypothetical protein